MQKKAITLVCALLLVLTTVYAEGKKDQEERLTSLTDEEMQQIKENSWCIDLRTSIDNTMIDAVQFAIFEQDPLQLLQVARQLREKINEGATPTAFDKEIEAQVDWDSIFDEVSGRDVFLLKAKTGKYDNVMISANTPETVKWLVTKVVLKKDGSWNTWIIPFDAQNGVTHQIQLNNKNAFDLNSL